MNVIEAMQARHSVRAYKSEPVDQEMILKILEVANLTPSWANTQPWEFYVATDKAMERIREQYVDNLKNERARNHDIPVPAAWPDVHKSRTMQMSAERFATLGIARDDKAARSNLLEVNARFFDAPAAIFICMDRHLPTWSLFDLGAASQSILLSAQHYGLNTVVAVQMAAWPEILRAELKIPDNLSIAIGIALGYGDPESIQNKYITKRRQIEEVAHIIGE